MDLLVRQIAVHLREYYRSWLGFPWMFAIWVMVSVNFGTCHRSPKPRLLQMELVRCVHSQHLGALPPNNKPHTRTPALKVRHKANDFLNYRLSMMYSSPIARCSRSLKSITMTSGQLAAPSNLSRPADQLKCKDSDFMFSLFLGICICEDWDFVRILRLYVRIDSLRCLLEPGELQPFV